MKVIRAALAAKTHLSLAANRRRQRLAMTVAGHIRTHMLAILRIPRIVQKRLNYRCFSARRDARFYRIFPGDRTKKFT
jgi:hypothetical protein